MNKVLLVGRVGRDPDIRSTSTGKTLANFSLATDRFTNGARQTEWHKCVAFDKQAETIEKYAPKGKELAIEGRLQTRDYIDKSGDKKYVTEVVVERVQLIGAKVATNGAGDEDENVEDISFA
jgi:single-strand DNA-binding protein